MHVLNYGSLNVDLVYRVPHISRPGETLGSFSRQVFAGGKGLNQSIALGRAGASVSHAGRTGTDGEWLLKPLREAGVATNQVIVGDTPSGHAVIQVEDSGENSIILFAGENMKQSRADINAVLAGCPDKTILLLQNEINDVAHLISSGAKRGFHVCLNPAPFCDAVTDFPLDSVDTLVVNETEAEGLAGGDTPDKTMDRLVRRYSRCEVVMTLGPAGVLYGYGSERIRLPAEEATVVDTTAAGDTFIGYYLAAKAEGTSATEALKRAGIAAALCVSKAGACESIPSQSEVDARAERGAEAAPDTK